MLCSLVLIAAHAPFASPDAPAREEQRLPVATADEASQWLLRGNVTLGQFRRACGLTPEPDGPGFRWSFPEGTFVTDGQRLPDGSFVIHSWGIVRFDR